ncbi:amino acid ABC transporter substrate-binding protein [Desulfobotulus sp. H1]|uniref:Amino acid ABC transporter substrate-binding protein n=1 Tax=Desulfobotulus pelophilus TaxID=2823377 RepID=A0ABT3N5X9_9BACT|nr:amino acid ABC transporter substrate-binding protein [Desulfobotulus pelophilus]MCW7752859.1 amino acid ABC transporter substrate-binding protein [Desulfobotulus pelophilus]
MKKIMMAVFCVMAMVLTAHADNSWERVQKAGKLMIGLDDAFAPMGYRLEDGTLVGFDVDAAEALGERMGIAIEWHPTAWDGVIHSLNSGKFDCIWNGMTITPTRAEQVNFTEPYIMDGQVVVVRFNETRFASYEDLGGMVVGLQKGSSALNALQALPEAPRDVREYADNPKALLDLESGRLDAVIIDNVVGRDAISKRIGRYKVLPGFITKEPFGVAFRKAEHSLRNRVQAELDAMVADGTLGLISEKWFGENIVDKASW